MKREIEAKDAASIPDDPLAAGRFGRTEHAHAPKARWALELYRECQRDAEGDPWHEPGGAERRFIARLREYAGEP